MNSDFCAYTNRPTSFSPTRMRLILMQSPVRSLLVAETLPAFEWGLITRLNEFNWMGRDEGSEDNLSDGKRWLFSDPSSLRLKYNCCVNEVRHNDD